MTLHAASPSHRSRAFTLLEVMVAMLMICIALGSILALNTRSAHTLRATRQTAAASQVLQQRVEAIRSKVWPEISNSTMLAALMRTATESERELAGTGIVEVVSVSPELPTATGPREGLGTFRVRRQGGAAIIDQAGDLGAEHTLLIESTITWTDPHGSRERTLKTIVCRAGLTRSGIFGSEVGR
ncbi:MAG: prepilin-type N-terminal cleavage/methylation domain-containing protein [Chthoniobacteraceae bacterium]